MSNQQLPGTTPIQQLIEDVVVIDVSRNVITFYLRTNRFDKDENDWVYLLNSVQEFALEITAIEPLTSNRDPSVTYVPLSVLGDLRHNAAVRVPGVSPTFSTLRKMG